MLLLEIIILAIVQGIGEFLPISSSGHLVVLTEGFERLGFSLGAEKLTVNIVLHLGTLAAILVFYFRRILALLGRDRRVIGLLAVGTVPAVVVGLGLESQLGNVLESALVAGFCFPLTGLALLWTTRARPGQATCAELTYGRALLIGLFQAVAILPGISRSGLTIVAGLGCGLRRDEAATFSFLLAIPVIAGAGVLETLKLLAAPPETTGLGLLAWGAVLSFLVGLAALWWLLRWLEQGRFYLFAWYVLLLGPAVIAWQLLAPR